MNTISSDDVADSASISKIHPRLLEWAGLNSGNVLYFHVFRTASSIVTIIRING